MGNMVRLVSIVMGLMVISPSTPAACTCIVLPFTREKAFKKYDQIFSGQVLMMRISSRPKRYEGLRSVRSIEILVEVHDVWKGDVQETVIIETSTTTCGYRFSLGNMYLIFARELHGGVYTDRCGLTMPIGLKSRTTLEELGEPSVAYAWGDTVQGQ